MMVEKAESVASRSSKKRKNRKKRARQWSYYIDNLKSTIDVMYELCRSEQSVAGCKEAVLYLQNAANDFTSLISTINLEKEWNDKEPQKRQSIAWEIRKSMSSPNPVNITEKAHLPISSIIAEAVKNVGTPNQELDTPKSLPESQSSGFGTISYARIAAAASLAAAAVASDSQAQCADDDGWQIVANRRRKSTSSTTVSEFDRETSAENEQTSAVPLNVYERLSSSSYKRGSNYSNQRSSNSNDISRLTCPRSAMDLPQTKASMAKMAYSRQLLWEKNQQILVEKLRAKQKKGKQSAGSSRNSSSCGFTFADPVAVRKSVEAFNEQKKNKKVYNQLTESESLSKSVKNHSLQSINENSEGETSTNLPEDVPADPSPSSSSLKGIEPKSLLVCVEDLENDEKWREMTEEEESLALEENSLKLEIKQTESISIDAELERQVEVEADRLEKEIKRAKKKKKKDDKINHEYDNLYKVFQEIQSLATVAWSEIMQNQQQSSSNVHEPGKPVEKHEKMSSPSRRKCEKDDNDFGKRHEMKLKKADYLRKQLQDGKAARVKELTKRVEEVRAKKANLMERKRKMLEERMQRAADNRDKNIMEVVKKAKDDDQRVLEVKFIANLQEDNKRYDILMKESEHEEKQKQLADERARKIEEKAAKKRQQKAAAENRREMAAQARKDRIRHLQEQKEARWVVQEKNRKITVSKKGMGVEKKSPHTNENDDNWLAQLLRIVEDENELKKNPWTWPSRQRFEVPKVCIVCETKVYSDIEAAAHLFSRIHGDKGIIMTTEQFKKNYSSIYKHCEKHDECIQYPDTENEIAKSREILMNCQIADSLTKYLSSPRNKIKCVQEFAKCFDKMLSSVKSTVSDKSIQASVENLLAELVGLLEGEQSQSNIEQICATGLIPKLVEAILEWTNGSVSLRLCVHLSRTLCILLKDLRVAYLILFKPEFLEIVDRVFLLIKTDSASHQLSALLDILNALFISVQPKNIETRRNKEIHNMDEKVIQIVEALAKYIENCINPEDVENAIEKNRGTAFVTKLVGFTRNLKIVNPNCAMLFMNYIHISLYTAYKLRRNCELKDVENETAKKHSIDNSICIIEMCQNMDDNDFEKLVQSPDILLILIVLLEDRMNKITDSLKIYSSRQNLNNKTLFQLCDFTYRIVQSLEYYVMKKPLIISWTGRNGIVQSIRNLPLSYLVDPNMANKTIGTIREVLDKFTVSEKIEAMNDLSDRFLDNDFIKQCSI